MDSPVLPRQEPPSPKSYGTAVALSSVLGFVGGHHFYLGRRAEGVLDAALSVAWVVCFALDHIVLGILFVVADFGHALVVTILLLTGNFRDGEGRPSAGWASGCSSTSS